jgi:hypothetical protein
MEHANASKGRKDTDPSLNSVSEKFDIKIFSFCNLICFGVDHVTGVFRKFVTTITFWFS